MDHLLSQTAAYGPFVDPDNPLSIRASKQKLADRLFANNNQRSICSPEARLTEHLLIPDIFDRRFAEPDILV